MTKKKILIQACVCLLITGGYIILGNSDSQFIKSKHDKLVAAVSTHYTIQDVFDKGKTAVAAVISVPASVTNYIINTQDVPNYGRPVDKTDLGEITSVYAVSGGQVIETGEDSKIGKYVKIKHDKAVSIYGNCNKIYVSEGKHVRRGYIIASYKNDGNKEFHYDLIEE